VSGAGKRRYRYSRGVCPHCQRMISGGALGSLDPGLAGHIMLRRHKHDPRHPGSPWCRGSREIVRASRRGEPS
jgi:hypothetical protein